MDAPRRTMDAPVVELAKSGRSSCRNKTKRDGCLGAPIAQGTPRIGVEVDANDRVTTHWYHPRCWFKMLRVKVAKGGAGAIQRVSDLDGYNSLPPDAQQQLARDYDELVTGASLLPRSWNVS